MICTSPAFLYIYAFVLIGSFYSVYTESIGARHLTAWKTDVVGSGFLFPTFRTDHVNPPYALDSAGTQRLTAAILAANEINADPSILPNTTFLFSYQDSTRDAGGSIFGASNLATTAFDQGVAVAIGPSSSEATENAQYVFREYGIPQISPSATSTLLNDPTAYPYFVRNVPSDAYQGRGIASVIAETLNWNDVAVVYSSDAYGDSLWNVFEAAAADFNINILQSESMRVDAADVSELLHSIKDSHARVIVVLCQASDSATLLRAATGVGVVGPGYTWLMSDASATRDLWNRYLQLSDEEAAAVLKGSFAFAPYNGMGSDKYSTFMDKWLTLSCTGGDECSSGCSTSRDDDAKYLWFHDVGDQTDVCSGLSYGIFTDTYVPFTYDAVYAAALALHDLIYSDGVLKITGSEFLAKLKTVSFEGITGSIAFDDAGQRVYEDGPVYTVLNHAGSTIDDIRILGFWDAQLGFTFCNNTNTHNVTADTGSMCTQNITYSTLDNSVPLDRDPITSEANVGLLMPFFDSISVGAISAALMAVDEINNSTDLLPETTIELAVFDTHSDEAEAFLAAFDVATVAFDGLGAHAVVGSAFSDTSLEIQRVLRQFDIVQISPLATSVSLREYPYFFRTPPDDLQQAACLADLISNYFGWTYVGAVASDNEYGTNGVAAFVEISESYGINVLVETIVSEDASTVDDAVSDLLLYEAMIVVLFTEAGPASVLLEEGYKRGLGGPGFAFLGSDATATSSLWENMETADTDPIMKGFFAVTPYGGEGEAYNNFKRNYLNLPCTGGDECEAGCSDRVDSEGTLVWFGDDDLNSTTPVVCAGMSYTTLTSFESYAYDAVFALAHAFHRTIYDFKDTEFTGPRLREAMLQTSFVGATGTVAFDEMGDRLDGPGYMVLNHHGEGSLDEVGLWTSSSGFVSCSDDPEWAYDTCETIMYSTEDNSLPKDQVEDAERVNVGVLMPFLSGPSSSVVDSEGVQYFSAFWMAIKQINANTGILPNTRLLVATFDNHRDDLQSFDGALYLAEEAFGERGVKLVMGPDSAAPAESAQNVLKLKLIPQITPSPTDLDASAVSSSPYFFRMVPDENAQSSAVAGVVEYFAWMRVAVVWASDSTGRYSALASAFVSEAEARSVDILAQVEVDGTESFDSAIETLTNEQALVIALFTDADTGVAFLSFAYEHGIGGNGFVFVGAEDLTVDGDWTIMGNSTEAVMKGYLGVRLTAGYGDIYDTFMSDWIAQPCTGGVGCATGCSNATDDNGQLIWLRSANQNETAGTVCAGMVYSSDVDRKASYAYDSAFAIAYAVESLVTQGFDEITGDDIARALVDSVSFAGATGSVSFDSVGERLGFAYDILNFQGIEKQLQLVGWWSVEDEVVLCYNATTGETLVSHCEEIVFSTEDNSVPRDTVPDSAVFRMGALFPLFYSEYSSTPLEVNPSGAYQMAAFLLAVEEINNSTTFLPNTEIRVSVQDTKGDAASSSEAARYLASQAFYGSGVRGAVGPATLSATFNAEIVFRQTQIPHVSHAMTAYLSTEQRLMPYLFRVVPTDGQEGHAVASLVREVLAFDRVAVVSTCTNYGSAVREAFNQRGRELGLTIAVDLPLESDTREGTASVQYVLDSIEEKRVTVVVVIAEVDVAAVLLEAAYDAGLLGPGYTWIGCKEVTHGRSWELFSDDVDDVPFAMNGYFGVSMSGGDRTSHVYTNAIDQWGRMGCTGGDHCDCSSATDDEGLPLWLRDHDLAEDTPAVCIGFDSASVDPVADEVLYAYDAVYAIAHAVRGLVEDEGLEFFSGEEVARALGTYAVFPGATGEVGFEEYGDRGYDVMFDAWNYQQSIAGLGWIATWYDVDGFIYCADVDTLVDDASCVDLVYSTADNSHPADIAPCPPGTFDNGELSCLDCSQYEYQDQEGQFTCKACPDLTVRAYGSEGDTIEDCQCVAGAYAPDPDQAYICEECPSGGVCDGLLAPPYPREGYWGYDDKINSRFVKCRSPKDRCEGGEDFECATGYEGRLCMACSEGYMIYAGENCNKCPTESAVLDGLFVFSIYLGVIGGWAAITSAGCGPYPIPLIIIYYIQTTHLVLEFNVAWPEIIRNVFAPLYLVSFNVDMVSPCGGMGGTARFLLQTCLPMLALMSYAGLHYTYRTFRRRHAEGVSLLARFGKQLHSSLRVQLENLDDVVMRNLDGELLSSDIVIQRCLCFLSLSYAFTARKIFQAFICEEDPDGGRWLALIPDVQCGSGEHTLMLFVAVVFIIGFLIGLPLFFVKVLKDGESASLLGSRAYSQRYRFLVAHCERGAVGWLLVLILRRIFFAFLSTVLWQQPLMQVGGGFFWVGVNLGLQTFMQPFHDTRANVLENVALFVLAFQLFAAAMYEASDDDAIDKTLQSLFIFGFCFTIFWGLYAWRSCRNDDVRRQHACNVIQGVRGSMSRRQRQSTMHSAMPVAMHAGASHTPAAPPGDGNDGGAVLHTMLHSVALARWVDDDLDGDKVDLYTRVDNWMTRVMKSQEKIEKENTEGDPEVLAMSSFLRRFGKTFPEGMDYLAGSRGEQHAATKVTFRTFADSRQETAKKTVGFSEVFETQYIPVVQYLLYLASDAEREEFYLLLDKISTTVAFARNRSSSILRGFGVFIPGGARDSLQGFFGSGSQQTYEGTDEFPDEGVVSVPHVRDRPSGPPPDDSSTRILPNGSVSAPAKELQMQSVRKASHVSHVSPSGNGHSSEFGAPNGSAARGVPSGNGVSPGNGVSGASGVLASASSGVVGNGASGTSSGLANGTHTANEPLFTSPRTTLSPLHYSPRQSARFSNFGEY
eukprot:Rmarinus@m.19292